jgi:hypothetical protein
VTEAAAPTTSPVQSLVADARRAGFPSDRVLASVARRVASWSCPDVDLSRGGPLLDSTVEPLDELTISLPEELLVPELLGDLLEMLQEREARRRRGAFFTPHTSAATVVELVTDGWTWPERPRVCDPACGGGAFLLAAARVLISAGHSPGEIVGELLWGVDADPLAVATTRAALSLWCATHDAPGDVPHVVVGDTLVGGPDAWPERAEPFDLVVGNPPFQSQLATRTARTRSRASEMRTRFGPISRGYADSSALFLIAALRMTATEGRCALILPESFLAARDAAPARDEAVERGGLVGLWLPQVPLFDASVRVCVPVFEIGRDEGAGVRRWRGPAATEMAGTAVLDGPDGWSGLAADLLGVPTVDVDPGAERLGSIATATAGFRDQFYGLRPFVREREPGEDRVVRLITSGAIDLVNDLTGRRAVTFARASFREPVVEIDRLRSEDPALGRWADRVLVPKVIVATQTRVIEVVVDEEGTSWPSVPVLAVTAEPERLWEVAAMLASPLATALAMRRHTGAALATDALKLSARQALDLPLPGDRRRWADGSEHLRRARAAASCGDGEKWRRHLEEFGDSMCAAYGASSDVLAWWVSRLPAFR